MPKEEGPTPQAIIAARHSANLTQTEAAAVVHTTCRVWQRWEAGDREMHPAFWELFQIKCHLTDQATHRRPKHKTSAKKPSKPNRPHRRRRVSKFLPRRAA